MVMMMMMMMMMMDEFFMRVKKPSRVLSLGIGATVDARDGLEGGLLVDL